MPLGLIRGAMPEWFNATAASATEIQGSATIELENGVGRIEVDLSIGGSNGNVTVRERLPGSRYPATCHERHIQSDHNFCIGVKAGEGITSHDHAVVWWGLLERFLRLQRVAQRTRRWPPQQEIAHGSAGPHQLAAVKAAEKLGIKDAYMRMLEGEPAWFSSKWPKLTGRGTMRNGRARCPMGCRRNGKAILRTDCCNRNAVVTLLREERLRQASIEQFWNVSLSLEEKCCETMLKCPLRGKNIYGDRDSDTDLVDSNSQRQSMVKNGKK